MIHYTRTRWYGINYLLQFHGSLLPRALPAMCLAATIAGLLSSGVLTPYLGWDPATFFEDPFGMQMFGVVFGYLQISRLSACYNRYCTRLPICCDDTCLRFCACGPICARGRGSLHASHSIGSNQSSPHTHPYCP